MTCDRSWIGFSTKTNAFTTSVATDNRRYQTIDSNIDWKPGIRLVGVTSCLDLQSFQLAESLEYHRKHGRRKDRLLRQGQRHTLPKK
jgi:hypothetical protein